MVLQQPLHQGALADATGAGDQGEAAGRGAHGRRQLWTAE
jgi:hypothetical protein